MRMRLLGIFAAVALGIVFAAGKADAGSRPDPDRPPCAWKSGHAWINFGTRYRACQLVGGTWVDVTVRLWNGKPSYLADTYGAAERAICEMTPWSKSLTTRTLRCGYLGRRDGWQTTWSWALKWAPHEDDERVGRYGGLADGETWRMTGCVDRQASSSECPYVVDVTARMYEGKPSYDPATLDTRHEKTYCSVTPWGEKARHLICVWKETGRIWKWSGRYGI